MQIYLIVLLMMICNGCQLFDNHPQIEFIIPDGYKGVMVVSAQDPDGIDSKSINNVITLPVDINGKVNIKEDLPFLKWHTLRAKYSSGKTIPIWQNNNGVSDDSIAFRSIGLAFHDRQSWFVIGTHEDVKKAMDLKYKTEYPEQFENSSQ